MKRNLLTTIIIFICILCFAPAMWAQPQCNIKTFTIKDGLASNMISSVTQDGNQLLWVGTWNGLCYFDGYGFSSVTSDINDEISLNNHLQSIKANSSGGIWCQTYDKRLYLYDTKHQQLIDCLPTIERKVGQTIRLRNIYVMPDGHTWITGYNISSIAMRIDDKQLADGTGIDIYNIGGTDKVWRKVEADDDGREWLFTSDGVKLYGTNFSTPLPFEYMQQVGTGVFFATKDGRMARYDCKSKKLRMIPLPGTIGRIACMKRIGGDRLLVGTDAGVATLTAEGKLAAVAGIGNMGDGAHVVSNIFTDSRGRAWVFTDGQGVTLLDVATNTCTWLASHAVRPEAATTFKHPLFVEDGNSTVWLVPRGGTFCYYDEAARRLVPYVLGTDGTHSDVNYIDKWFIDSQHNIWVLSTHNLMRVNLLDRKIKTVPIEQNVDVRAIGCIGGSMYIGLNNGKMARLGSGLSMESMVGADLRPSTAPLSKVGRIYAIFTDRRGRTWIGTKGDGLYLVERGKATRHFTYDKADAYSLFGNEVYDFYEDDHGRIWVACFDLGLNLIDERPDGAIRFINTRNRLRSYPTKDFCDKVRHVTGSQGKAVILTTAGGVIAFDENFTDPSHIKYNLYADINDNNEGLSGNTLMHTLVASDGRIYLSATTCGLAVSEGDPLSGKMTFRSVDEGSRRTGIILSMAEDGDGCLWLARENYLERYDTHTGKTEVFGVNDFGRKVSFTEAKPCYSAADSLMLMGTNDGIITFNPHRLRKDGRRPNIVFTTVQYPNDATAHQILFTDMLDVPSDHRNLTINFAALDYRDQSETQYAYKLEGIDDEWNYIGTRRNVSFHRLPAGRLRLLVRSTNAEGVWTDNVATLNIHSHPTFWETIWAKLLYVLLALGAIAVAVYVISLRRKSQMEEEMNTLRTNFYTEASHRLRTPLTLIGGPTAEVLAGSNVDERERGLLEMVLRNTRRMLDLVNKMLEHGAARNYFVDDANAPVFAAEADENLLELTTTEPSGGKSLRLLVVEDNDDLRHFLVSILNHDYTVIAAANGQEGLDAAVRDMPDFIITDVNMPVMDGFEMIHRIKQNADTCHIPIIVLSAKASLDDKLKGLSEGVDDYITKPFSATYLKHRIENIVAQRRMLQDSILERLSMADGRPVATEEEKPAETEQESKKPWEDPHLGETDRRMMERLMTYLENNLSDSDMKIADLASEVGMSRTVFYGKLKGIVGMSPVDFVRYLRLQRAEHLIVSTQQPLSNIAYEVGFTDPNYFGKCFKKALGMSPTEYRAAKGRGE